MKGIEGSLSPQDMSISHVDTLMWKSCSFLKHLTFVTLISIDTTSPLNATIYSPLGLLLQERPAMSPCPLSGLSQICVETKHFFIVHRTGEMERTLRLCLVTLLLC